MMLKKFPLSLSKNNQFLKNIINKYKYIHLLVPVKRVMWFASDIEENDVAAPKWLFTHEGNRFMEGSFWRDTCAVMLGTT